MIRYLLALFILVSFGTRLNAQKRDKPIYMDTLAVRVSPLGLVDVFDGNLTVGVAYTLNTRWTMAMDVSSIFYSEYIHNKQAVYGYIIKPSFRYYFSAKRRFFIEAAPFYKRVGYKIKDWLSKDVVNGVASYEQLTTFTFRKQVVGLNTMMGVQKGLTRDNSLRLEIYAGIGFRYKWQDIKHDPRAVHDPNRFFESSLFVPKLFTPGVPHGLRVVYVIR